LSALTTVSLVHADHCLEQQQGASALLQTSSARKQLRDLEEEEERETPVRGLHRAVGPDGVIMMSLDRQPERSKYSRAKLAEVGINVTLMQATDGKDDKVPQKELDAACQGDNHFMGGCATRSLAALVDSHRRAWLLAQERSWNWTAILEDDAIPVFSDGWKKEFDAAWALLPPKARVVRLGRCAIKNWATPEKPSMVGMKIHSFARAGQFRVIDWTGFNSTYDSEACTHAYVIHKSIIPDLLAILPCNCPLDCCLYNKIFNKPGQDFLFNIDTGKTPDDAFMEAEQWHRGFLKNVMQFGIMKQAWDTLTDSTTGDAMQQPSKDDLSLFSYSGWINIR
jgi:GR25 family glycosyltransferase involved in LPS biosynthesis